MECAELNVCSVILWSGITDHVIIPKNLLFLEFKQEWLLTQLKTMTTSS